MVGMLGLRMQEIVGIAELGVFRDYLLQSIDDTNLVLVVVMNKIDCRCRMQPMDMGMREKQYAMKEERCVRLSEKKHRMRPPECHSFDQRVSCLNYNEKFALFCPPPHFLVGKIDQIDLIISIFDI